MTCPFCLIAAGSAPSSDPPILTSPQGSAFLLLSTPLVVAFLDIAPISRGHVLICPREHRSKVTDLTGGEAAAIGFLLPVLSRCIMQALGGMAESASWNVVQANGAEAGQTVSHTHFHIIPRSMNTEDRIIMTDAERANIALGTGPRVRLDAVDGEVVTNRIKEEITKEIARLKVSGEVTDHDEGAGKLWAKVSGLGLQL